MDELPYSEEVNEVVEDLMDSLEKRGLYALDGAVALHATDEASFPETPEEFRSKLELGDLRISGSFLFKIGEYAWDDRNLNPEAFEEAKTLSEVLPDEEEIVRSFLEKNADDWWESD